MELKRKPKNKIDEYLTSLGFIFPRDPFDLKRFDSFYKDYVYELTGKEIDPVKIYKDQFSKVNSKLSKSLYVKSSKPTYVDYYKRMLLAGEIVSQLHNEMTLGHLKLQKLIYLCQQTSNMNIPTNFLREAMGPYDPQLMRSIDKKLEEKRWFKYNIGNNLKYKPLEKAGTHHKDFQKYFKPQLEQIDYLINTFRTESSSFTELVATLFACKIDIIEKKEIYSKELIIKKFYDWSEHKLEFKSREIDFALTWMERKDLNPIK